MKSNTETNSNIDILGVIMVVIAIGLVGALVFHLINEGNRIGSTLDNQTGPTYKTPHERCQKYCSDTFTKGTETWNNCMYDTCKDIKDD